jgi:hypothetical protein
MRSPTVTKRHDARGGAAGQAVVIMVGCMLAVIVMVGLIIDGGNAWAQQRIVQNGSDAAAEAGAVIMGQRLAGATAPVLGWDAAVASAVNASATANGITVSAYYTDICGIPLKSDGSAALTAANAYDFASAQPVGAGLPATTSSTPDCPSHQVGPAAGVIALGHKDVQTYLVNVVGISTWSVDTQATAAAGYLQEGCDASQGDACALLPVAITVDIVTCDKSNNPVTTGLPWSADGVTVYKVPLCGNSPGNVGWLDWTPPSGGTPELIQSIQVPDNPAIPLPSWQYVAQTGGPNAPGVESAIRAYDGQIVLIPQFDLTCNPGHGGTPDSSIPAINNSPNYGCPAGDLGGNGVNQWYRVPSFAHFQLCISTDAECVAEGASYGAYTNGNNKAVCDTGNGATQCLVGKFVSIEKSGTIGAGFGGGTGNSKAIGIQLIK